MPSRLHRRSFLSLALSGLGAMTAGGSLSACASGSSTSARQEPGRGSQPSPPGPRPVLLAYFSRPGENYWDGGRKDLEVGNTEILARIIRERLNCDVHRIEPVDPYSDDDDETVERNVREQNANARPAIVNPPSSIAPYHTILLASPIWNVRAPMIMTTFAERYDFAGKTVHPVTTYAMSGLGTTAEDYARSCQGARIGPGLAVRGERAHSAHSEVDSWLHRTQLRGRPRGARP